MRKQRVQKLLFILYLAALLRITVFRPGCFSHPLCSGRLNLIPGVAYRDLLGWGSCRAAARLFFGNVLWFMPLGMHLSRRGWDFYACLLAGLLLSLAIEGGQFILGSGLAETDDLLLNTLGAIAGWKAYRLAARG